MDTEPDKCPSCGYKGSPLLGWCMGVSGGNWRTGEFTSVLRCHACGKDHLVGQSPRVFAPPTEVALHAARLEGARLALDAVVKDLQDYEVAVGGPDEVYTDWVMDRVREFKPEEIVKP